MKLLFVTWDGPGSDYHESLFMPILDRVCQSSDEVHLLQFQWDADARAQATARAAARLGMRYTLASVWRGGGAASTVATVGRGAVQLRRYVRRHEIDVLMPRSILPAAMALMALPTLPGVRLLYDADGLGADERVDFGGWSPKGRIYRAYRAVERAAVRRADAVITRSAWARDVLAERAGPPSVEDRIVVVSNGKDAGLFAPGDAAARDATRAGLGIAPEAPVVAFVGSMGPLYNPDRMLAFAEAVRRRRPETAFVFMSGSPDLVRQAIAASDVPDAATRVFRAPPGEVPAVLAASDLGLAFYGFAPSMRARAPIKVGEYLLCGLPVLSTTSVGDVAEQVDASVGRLLHDLDDATLDAAADWFVTTVLPERAAFRERCRQRGLNTFSLNASVSAYRRALRLAESGHGETRSLRVSHTD